MILGDTKENYRMLQNSTGERYAHMADRLTTPEVLANLDENGRAANEELADWLRNEKDDEEAVTRKTDPDDATVAAQKRQEAERADFEANRSDRDDKPRARTSNRQQNT